MSGSGQSRHFQATLGGRFSPQNRHSLPPQDRSRRARNRLLHRNKFGEVQRVKSGLRRTEALGGRFRKSLSGVQLVEQHLSLFQIERVETFGEATVDGG
jgi:hypothetical protein